MALAWQKSCDGIDYEVRTAGHSIRLYTNGVFHSQWNPNRVLANALWDLLVLPGFLLPRTKPLKILVLGVGGGTVLRQALQLFPVGKIVGVDLDEVHLQIARDWFGLSNNRRIQLVHADAKQWITAASSNQFDLVIDDLFGHHQGEAMRGVAIDAFWIKQLRRVSTTHSVIVGNTGDAAELHRAQDVVRKIHRAGSSNNSRTLSTEGYALQHPAYENSIFALVQGDARTTTRQWRSEWLLRLESSIDETAQLKIARQHLLSAYRLKL